MQVRPPMRPMFLDLTLLKNNLLAYWVTSIMQLKLQKKRKFLRTCLIFVQYYTFTLLKAQGNKNIFWE